jgi:hypothetical protein
MVFMSSYLENRSTESSEIFCGGISWWALPTIKFLFQNTESFKFYGLSNTWKQAPFWQLWCFIKFD